MTKQTETEMTDRSKETNATTGETTQAAALSPLFKRHARLIIGSAFLFTLCGAILLIKSTAFASLDQDQIDLSRALTVTSTTLHATDHYQIRQKYSGNIVAGRESDHGFDTSGVLADVLVDEGDFVKKGDIIARLDQRRLNAKEKELDAALQQAIALDLETAARLDRAQATYDRYTVLSSQKHISNQKFDEVKFDLIALKAHKTATAAAVNKSKAALKSLQIDRDLANLTARFDGNVIRRYQDEGTALSPGAPVLRLIEGHKLEIHVGLPQSALSGLRVAEKYTFDYHGVPVTTTLRSILNRLDQSTRTVTAIFDVTGPQEQLHAGNIAQLALTSKISEAGFWVPSDALAESRRGLWSVYSLSPHNGSQEYSTLTRQELQVIYTDSDRVFVRGTLKEGDRIVSRGMHRLVDGQLVRAEGGK